MRPSHLACVACGMTLLAVLSCTGGGDGSSSSGDGGASSSSGSSSSGGPPTYTPSPLSDEGFSRDCAVDDDCVPAFFGNVCNIPCAGSNDTIAKSSQNAYQTAFNAAREKCPPINGAGICFVGEYHVTKCGAAKKCERISCGQPQPADPHNCASDAGAGKATPQVIFAGTVRKGSNASCASEGVLFRVGELPSGTTPSSPVKDGASTADGNVSVACTVAPAGNAFRVDATVTLSGANGGLYKLAGTFAKTGDQPNISVVGTSKVTGNDYSQADCVAHYVTPSQGVAAGRVWAEILCPGAATATGKCELAAEVRFENCTQQ